MASAPQLTVISPDPARHAEQVIELFARTFSPYYGCRKLGREMYVLHSHYDWGASAVGLLAPDQLVTHWGVWDYRMRIGGAVVRCGGIGGVATDAEHRQGGLMARTAPHSIARMRERGYDLSILFGISDFYHRFGYVPAWAEEVWFLDRGALPAELPRLKLETLPKEPTPELARLHARHNAGLTGTAVRPTYTRGFFTNGPTPQAYGWRDGRGRLAGHVLVADHEGALLCFEATGDPDAALSALRKLSVQRETKDLRFLTQPRGGALARRLRGLTGRLQQEFDRDGGPMVRVVNLDSCLRKLEGELSARLSRSELRGGRGVLSLGGEESTVRLALGDGKVRVAGTGAGPSTGSVRLGARMGQLLIGSADPLELCEAARARPRGDAARVLPVLFPAQHPQLHMADRY